MSPNALHNGESPNQYSVGSPSTIVCTHRDIENMEGRLFFGREVDTATLWECLQSRNSTQCRCGQLLSQGDETSLLSLDAGVREGSVDINARRVVVSGFLESIRNGGVSRSSLLEMINKRTQASGMSWFRLAAPDDNTPSAILTWFSLAALDDKTTTARLTWFLRHGFDINQPVDSSGKTLLHRACQRPARNRFFCQLEYLNALLENGARLDVTDSEGDNPLHVIAKAGCLTMFLDALLKSANGDLKIIDAVNQNGETPLSIALGATSWLGKALLLLRAGASVQKNPASTVSPLFSLIESRRASDNSIELLIQYGADINEVHEGRVPSHQLVRQFDRRHSFNQYSGLMRLIEEGIPLNKVDSCGETLFTKVFSLPERFHWSLDRKGRAFNAQAILVAWYKYNFPGHIDRLEGAISDKCIETYEADFSMLLETFADAFYLIDHTADIIGKGLNQANMAKLRELLEKFRGHHRQDISLKPFVHCSPESFRYCPIRMNEMARTLTVGSFPQYRLDVEGDNRGYDTVFPAVIEYGVTDDVLLRPSDIKITDWLVENKRDALQTLLCKQHDLFKVVVANKAAVLSGLTEQNRISLESLIKSVPKDLPQDDITPRLSELRL